MAAASGTFAHGVASGDPLAGGVVLWTRVSGTDPGGADVAWTVDHRSRPQRRRGHRQRQGRTENDFTVTVEACSHRCSVERGAPRLAH